MVLEPFPNLTSMCDYSIESPCCQPCGEGTKRFDVGWLQLYPARQADHHSHLRRTQALRVVHFRRHIAQTPTGQLVFTAPLTFSLYAELRLQVLTERFEYQPLDLEERTFRLVRLLRGDTGPIQCELFHAFNRDEDDLLEYEALSYAWGSLERSCSLRINGRKCTSRRACFRP